MDRLLQKIWYDGGPVVWPLLPASWLYKALFRLHVWLYRRGILKAVKVPAPVIVIGNITVGGTGKTPLAIWLSQRLRRQGLVPGIVSRGYGARSDNWPKLASLNSDPVQVGDEALVLVRRSGCRVAVGPDRVAAARLLLNAGVNVIISDDGLQHHRMARDLEILVIDGERGFGNGRCLPAGPLREPASRISSVDIVIQNGGQEPLAVVPDGQLVKMKLRQLVAVPVAGGEARRLVNFRGSPVHALAGIGNPERFFVQLEGHGLEVIRHPFPDHARLTMNDVLFMDDYPVLMTEKDAVKCIEFADQRHFYVPVTVDLRDSEAQQIFNALAPVLRAYRDPESKTGERSE